MVDIELLRLVYFQNEEPVPYQLKSGYVLNIHPIKVKHWSEFENSLSLLMIRKNEVNDIRVIQMSYLQYLHDLVIPSDDIYRCMFYTIMTRALDEKMFYLDKSKGRRVIGLGNEDGTVKGLITHKEFDEISKIILFQNIVDFDDREVNPEVREMMEEYQSLKNKETNSPTLERKKVYVIGRTGIPMRELNEMTYRTFSQVYSSELDSEIYIAQKMIQASPKYDTGKKNIIHPLFEKKKDIYEEMFLDNEGFQNKINQANNSM